MQPIALLIDKGGQLGVTNTHMKNIQAIYMKCMRRIVGKTEEREYKEMKLDRRK
jgi:hypothetical protein